MRKKEQNCDWNFKSPGGFLQILIKVMNSIQYSTVFGIANSHKYEKESLKVYHKSRSETPSSVYVVVNFLSQVIFLFLLFQLH